MNRKRMHMNLNKSKLKLRSGGEQGVRGEKESNGVFERGMFDFDNMYYSSNKCWFK